MIPTEQVPGLYHQRIGQAVVTAVNDGNGLFNLANLCGITPDDATAQLHAIGRSEPLLANLNTYLVREAGRTLLIDTGVGTLWTPATGRMMVNLAIAEVGPGDIDAILLTHMHIDHVGGLTDASGAAQFPRATLMVQEHEAAFWLDGDIPADAPAPLRQAKELARRMVAPYAGRLHRFKGAPLPGVEAMPLQGHTIGHTGYRFGTGADQLLIWGDICHMPDVQIAHPEIGVVFDADPAMAIATRRAVFKFVATERIMVAGMHMNFPGFMHLVAGAAGYVARPVVWAPLG